MDHQHRSGSFKQSNKPFKAKHSTKGALKRKQGGKVDVKKSSGKAILADQRDQRKNRLKQLRSTKQEKIQKQYKHLSSGEAPPRIVGIIPLGITSLNSSKTHEALFLESQNDEMLTVIPRTFHVSKWKQRVSIIPCQRNLDEILQIVQIANVIVFTVPENGIDDIGFETLRIIRAQGFPSIMATTEADKNVVHHKKAIEKQLCYEFGEKSVKVIQHSKTSEVLRAICQIRLQEEVISRFIPRPYLLIDEPPKYVQNGDNFGTEISGYLRGGSLNANQLLHIPGYGDFQMHAILSKKDPHPSKLSHDKMEPEVANEILSSAEPGKQESLESENEPNPLDSEQPMFTHENIPQLGKKVPKGTSSYQATWILEEGDELSDEEVKDENTMDLQESSDIPLDDDEEDDEEEYEYLNSAESFSSKMEDKRKLEQEDIDFPDEIETPEDVPARVRFQKYRGLKSFRTSPWDPKEELPRDYARIYQFRSMKRTQNRVLDEHDGIETGTYITIQVINVPKSFVDNYSPSKPILAIGLFQYERKLSVLNFTIRRTVNYTDPIASKDELIFVCGSRWLVCNPLFSEHSATSDKHKYEKFWLPTTTSVATIYGPVMFSPCPLLIFKKLQPGETVENSTAIDGLILVGSGSLLSVDPDRLNIKKITLTGEPFKVLKRKAVIRRMFHNPEDIQWFKPVELRTRLGHTGNILESVGLHGHMRCLFDSQLKQHDVIMMNLYKRIYPKYKSNYLLQQ